MKLSLLPLLVLPLLVACGASAPEEAIVTTTSSIQGGTLDVGHPAVGLVGSQFSFCTGTLIAPDVVLTAAHCMNVATQFTVTVEGLKRTYAVVAKRAYPGFSLVTTCPSKIRDLAVLRLERTVDDVVPVALGAAPNLGAVCVAVGYGTHDVKDGDDDATVLGTKYQGTEIMSELSEHTIGVTAGSAMADHGDSGGPLLFNDQLIGTTSCHTAEISSPDRREHYERVDQDEAAEFIRTAIAEL